VDRFKRRSLFLGPCKNILVPTMGPRNKLIEEGRKDEYEKRAVWGVRR